MKLKSLRYTLLAAASAFVSWASASDSLLVADFEQQTNKNVIDGFWYYVDDNGSGGNSKIISGDTTVHPVIFSAASFGAGANGSSYSGRLEYVMGTKNPSCGGTCTYSPEVLLGTNVIPEFKTSFDATGATSLTFWAKATPALKIAVVYTTLDITDYSYPRTDVSIGTEWAKYTVYFTGSAATTLKSTYGMGLGKPVTISQTTGINFTVQKTSNPTAPTGVLLLDDIYFQGLKGDVSSIRSASRPSASQALQAAVDGQSLRFSVPEAYRNVSGTVAAMDLSGKKVAEAAFSKGQESVSLKLRGRQASTVFLRVFAGSEAIR